MGNNPVGKKVNTPKGKNEPSSVTDLPRVFSSFNLRSHFSGKYQENTLPGIYRVFTWVFTWVFTDFASQFGIYLGIYLGKYPEFIYLKLFTFSLLANLRNFKNF